ncbi:MAG: rubrerythrin [Planctomycetes bacterium]|nr:rubrerythrin [Planctomycetota bacterium]
MPTRLDFSRFDLRDALDLAVLIEAEAYDRYQLFAAQLGPGRPGDAASVFASMAQNEAKHGKELAVRRKELFGDTPRQVSRDDLFDVEAPETGAVRAGMSTRKAFEVALAAEQKARDFYDEALAHVVHPTVRALFAELRDEETEHVNLLRSTMAGLGPEADEEWEEDKDDYPAL